MRMDKQSQTRIQSAENKPETVKTTSALTDRVLTQQKWIFLQDVAERRTRPKAARSFKTPQQDVWAEQVRASWQLTAAKVGGGGGPGGGGGGGGAGIFLNYFTLSALDDAPWWTGETRTI